MTKEIRRASFTEAELSRRKKKIRLEIVQSRVAPFRVLARSHSRQALLLGCRLGRRLLWRNSNVMICFGLSLTCSVFHVSSIDVTTIFNNISKRLLRNCHDSPQWWWWRRCKIGENIEVPDLATKWSARRKTGGWIHRGDSFWLHVGAATCTRRVAWKINWMHNSSLNFKLKLLARGEFPLTSLILILWWSSLSYPRLGDQVQQQKNLCEMCVMSNIAFRWHPRPCIIKRKMTSTNVCWLLDRIA